MSGYLPNAPLGATSTTRAWVLRGAVFLLATGLAVLAGWQFFGAGNVGVQAALVAAAVCLPGLFVPAVLSLYFRGPSAVLWNVAFGMLFRMGLPLGWVLWLVVSKDPLVNSGAVYLLLPIYLSSLAVETLLMLPPPGAPVSAKAVSGSNPIQGGGHGAG